MSFGIGVLVGAVGMLFLQIGTLCAFALREIFNRSRKGMKYIEATKETDS